MFSGVSLGFSAISRPHVVMNMATDKETTMRRRRESHREGSAIYRATVTDTISRETIGRFTFSADTIEEARQRAWRMAGTHRALDGASLIGGTDIHVRVERISK